MNPPQAINEGSLPHYALVTPEEAERYAKTTSATTGHWALMEFEVRWRDRQQYLEERGYLLRPRYAPDWSPSWHGTLRRPDFCEDSNIPTDVYTLDATRKSDGMTVSIKVVPTVGAEIEIGQILSAEDNLRNPTNHCVQVLEVLPDPLDATKSLLITPYLRPFDNPAFLTTGEVVECIKQTLEGLCFIHGQRIAHGDCTSHSIMMDAREMFPEGHHPTQLGYLPDGIYDVHPLPRADHKIKYYFGNYGCATHFGEGETPLVTGTDGRVADVPEVSPDVPYNAFKLDVFLLGEVYQKSFVTKYQGLEFLAPLVSSMTNAQPEHRPTAEDALLMFQRIRAELDGSLLRWRLRPHDESTPARVVYDAVAVAREGFFQIKRLIG